MEQGSENKRCERCRANSGAITNLRRSRRYETVIVQETFAALESSAHKGCDICKLLRQGLIYSTASPAEYEALQSGKQSIVLWYSPANTFQKGMFPPSTRDNFVVSCSVYPKSHMNLIPFHFGPEHGGEEPASSSDDVGQRSALPPDSSSKSGQASMQAIRSFVAGWISTCRDSHADCGLGGIRSDAGTSTLPTRVIDLESSDGPRLFITEEASTDLRSQPYTALSHCWGAGARHLTTTKANLEQMVRGIPMEEMPQTYLDAFKVNQSLGVRYIWIDALCIVQDDQYDWQVESAKMCDIYRDAYCTIAANAAQSNSQGCFMEKHGLSLPTDSCRLVAEENGHRSAIVLLPPRPSWKNQILSSPLNGRAWVLQERLLSPRILHFAKDAIFWECSELKSSQFEPNGIPDVELLADPVSYAYALRNLTAAECVRSAWLQLVQHYTKLGITKVEDRLPALSGLAKVIQAKTKDTYVAGLWKSSLVEGLTWALSGKDFKSEELHNKRPYTAPSWSWASTDRDLGFLTVTDMTKPIGSAKSAADWDWRFDVEILNFSIQLAGPDPTGQVFEGSITLSGHIHILPVVTTRSLPVGSTDQIDPGNLERSLQPGVEAQGSANFIHLDYPKDPSIVSFPALRLCHRSPNDQAQTCLLVLEATGKDQYKRIGRAVLYGLAPATELDKRIIELV